MLVALLVAAGPAPAALAQGTPEPGAGETPEATPIPRTTSTPRPDGSIIHIVQPGDTLGQLARDYGVSLDDLRRLNAEAIGEGDLIFVGQALVIVAPALTPTAPGGAPTSTPRPTSTPTVPPTAVPTALPTATPTTPAQPTARPPAQASPTPPGAAAVCVLAYHDREGDRTWEPGQEELLPGAVFTLTIGGAALHYTTDGVLEPYCFEGLEPGNYTLTLEPPAGYDTVGAASAVLTVGSTVTRAFGCRRSLDLSIAPTAAAPTGGLANAPVGQKLLIAAGLLGAAVAVGAVTLRLLLARGSPLL